MVRGASLTTHRGDTKVEARSMFFSSQRGMSALRLLHGEMTLLLEALWRFSLKRIRRVQLRVNVARQCAPKTTNMAVLRA